MVFAMLLRLLFRLSPTRRTAARPRGKMRPAVKRRLVTLAAGVAAAVRGEASELPRRPV